ncbi:MAG TPA: response regulator [Phycisphaerales bacterium]|nr:response regulator [Phycisphaerales bacterium]
MNMFTPSRRPSSTPKQPQAPEPGRLRVLVADDEHLVATEIAAQLESLGYIPIGPVGSGRDALALCRVDPPDLALLDIHMPDGDGIATARSLLQELVVPSVILSAYSDVDCVRRAEESGVFGYLVKPADGDQLRAALEVAWGRFKKYMVKATENDELRQRLADRKVIERAKWILVNRAGVDESTAMRLLIEHSRRKGERVIVTAKRVIQTGQGVAQTTGASESEVGV